MEREQVKDREQKRQIKLIEKEIGTGFKNMRNTNIDDIEY